MVEATQKFAEINVTVRSQERRLRQDLHKDALADSLSALQKGEEAKLRFTLIQQVCTGSLIRPQDAPFPSQEYETTTVNSEGMYCYQIKACVF